MRADEIFLEDREHPLRLLPISIEAVESELAEDGRLGDILGAEVTAEWPPEDWERHVLELLLRTFRAHPAMQALHRYVLLDRPGGTPVLIGAVGGFVWRERPREMEVGYAILPQFRRRGYAMSAMRQHARWLLARPEQYDLVAQTFPHLEASIRILNSLGFERDGSGREEGTIAFRRRWRKS